MPDQVQAVILTSAGGDISEEGGLDGMPQDIADGWRRASRDPGGARARLEAAVAGLRADPLESLRTMTSTFPADEREWVERNSGALATDMAEAMRQGVPAGGSMARPSASRGRSTSLRYGRRSTSSTVTATAWRRCRSCGEASPGQHSVTAGAPLPWRQPLRSLGHAGTPGRYARRHPRLMTHPWQILTYRKPYEISAVAVLRTWPGCAPLAAGQPGPRHRPRCHPARCPRTDRRS